MTSIVGVLNKRAVAIAADSAVTVGNTHKVMNTGNKLFSLSKYAPVGIAIYGEASFMDTPWEVIIKCYHKQIKKEKFLYLKDYVNHFLDFLRNHEFFASPIIQHRFLRNQMESFYRNSERQASLSPLFHSNRTQAMIEEFNRSKSINRTITEIIPDFAQYLYGDFKNYAKDDIVIILKASKVLDPIHHFDVFAESFYHYMRISRLSRARESGLVFVGYGEEEIYPCLYNVVVSIGFEHKLQYRYGEIVEITNENTTASIVPFAQVEATQTIIRGINPSFYDIISNVFSNVLGSFRKSVSDLVRTQNVSSLADQIDGLDISSLTRVFTDSTQSEFFNHYSLPLVNTIGLLGVSDMANVAESLVALTSLVHRMSPKEESVGGPVDVAVISKGEGMVWIKRKHYFDPNLNTQFFKNYNND